MSRVGKPPIPVPSGVTVEIGDGLVSASGKLGALTVPFSHAVTIERQDGTLVVKPTSDTQEARRMWGTVRACLQNAVHGVGVGFSRKLELVGVGYRAQLRGRDLVLQLGYSHEIVIPAKDGIKFECPDNTHITVSGHDKQAVGQVCANIKALRPVEPYKGKGVRYEGQYVIRKEGKKK